MQIIPVIDVKNGIVVHARGGDRAKYQPLASPLAESAAPADAVAGLLRLFPFDTLYVADLDGIMDGAPNARVLNDLRTAFPDLHIWLDNGLTDAVAIARQSQNQAGVRAVIGTESLRQPDEFATLTEQLMQATGEAPILSLDIKRGAIIGADLMSVPQLWPDTVIVMALDAVGASAGPDFDRVGEIRRSAPRATRVVAAGGVRDRRDLEALSAVEADASLIASALHSGTLKASDLVEITGLRHR